MYVVTDTRGYVWRVAVSRAEPLEYARGSHVDASRTTQQGLFLM